MIKTDHNPEWMDLRRLPFVEKVRPLSESVQLAGDNSRLLTLGQVADKLGVSKAWVRDHATRRNPRIPVVRFGDRRAVLRFRPQDVEQFIAQHLVLENSV